MHGHVRAGFSAFCLLFALPLTLPLLLPAIREISLSTVSLAYGSAPWLPLGLAAVLLLGGVTLARRGRATTAASTSG